LQGCGFWMSSFLVKTRILLVSFEPASGYLEFSVF
jgi:hypothetical protein